MLHFKPGLLFVLLAADHEASGQRMTKEGSNVPLPYPFPPYLVPVCESAVGRTADELLAITRGNRG